MVTASQLYSHLVCPHRVTMDAHADASLRDPPNPFVELLWERGSLFEREVVSKIGQAFTDLSSKSGAEKELATREAIVRGDALIYAGRLSHGDLLGEPDLLRREGTSESGIALYAAIDIKSGSGEEGGEDDGEPGKPKKTYGVQLALYTDLLIRSGASVGRHAYVWDIHGRELRYDLDARLGVRSEDTMWSIYEEALASVSKAISTGDSTNAAAAASCKLCVWRSACLARLRDINDLTLLPELGRAKRDSMQGKIPTVRALASADLSSFIAGRKTMFPGIGPDTLKRLQERAQLLVQDTPLPYSRKVIAFPRSGHELFFDIETDPMRDICYLHGFVERKAGDNAQERYVSFFAESADQVSEKAMFNASIEFICEAKSATIYIYSKYERTIYRALQRKYPDVCSLETIEAIFAPDRTVDLYFDVIKPNTEWPTLDFSIKSVAKCLGFDWRDLHPSGAASIQWFDEFLKSPSAKGRQRILDYNEDDCRAMRILVDALPALPVIGRED